MLSRVAESIYWMSRYIERADNLARFLDVNQLLALDLPGGSETNKWMPLVATTGDHAFFEERYSRATRENVIRFLTFDREYPNSILSCLTAARENARSIREVISSELWFQINEFYQFVREAERTPENVLTATTEFLTEIKSHGYVTTGVFDTTMTHDEPWQFARMGRMIERADKISRILDVKYYVLLPKMEDLGTPLDNIQWGAVLRSVCAREMYQKRYHRITPQQVAEFLVLNRTFPRAIHYCLIVAENSLHLITATPESTFSNPAEQRLGRLRGEFTYLTTEDIINQGMHEFLDSLQGRLNSFSEAAHSTFFAQRALTA